MHENLKSWAKERGHLLYELPENDSYNYIKKNYNPKSIIGIIMHSFLSGRPRKNYYFDNKHIYYPQSNKVPESLNKVHLEDIARESKIMDILNGSIYNYKLQFEETDGHLRLKKFDDIFQKDPKKYQNIGDISIKLIDIDEENNIKRRIQRKYHLIKNFMLVVKYSDLKPYHEILKNNLEKYNVSF